MAKVSSVGGTPHRRCTDRLLSRYTGLQRVDDTVDVNVAPDLSPVPASVPRVARGEVIVTVAVCARAGAKEQEFDVLATQPLHELRDALHFVTDWHFDGPTRLQSACFFIDGIFYSDKRDPTALDYSTDLIEWIKATNPSLLRAESSESMDVRLCDLGRIPLGERCIYIHQGDLEHNVIFTNVRLAEPGRDCPFREAYPLLTFMRRYNKRRCYACLQLFAIWMVMDSSRCPHNPSYWCASCFRHFFQDAAGEFLPPVDYKIFPYLHDDT